MRTTIYKYPLKHPNGGDLQEVVLPRGAKVLHAGMQDGNIFLWVKVMLDFEPERRLFRVVGTGWEIGANCGEHLGTVFDGPYVWHVFEVV